MDSLHSPGYSDSLLCTLQRRISNMFVPFELDFCSGNTDACVPLKINLQNCISTLQELRVSDRAKVAKTWLHGWATSHRIKGDFLHMCLLGCSDGSDRLSHYVQCPRIYATSKFVCEETPPCPLQRLGLLLPRKQNLLLVACAFEAYHALKNDIRNRFDASNLDMIDYNSNWIFFARHFSAAAVERLLLRALFNPLQFNSFLNSFLND